MWTCKECETINQDGDRFCACCGAAAPAAQTPRAETAGTANAQGPQYTAAQTGTQYVRQTSAQTHTQNAAQRASQGEASYTLPTATKKPFPVAALVVIVAVAALLAWRLFVVATTPEQRYTADTAVYTAVYADVVSLDPVTTVNYAKKDSVVGEPRYVVCRCACEDQSSFLMVLPIEEYQRFDDKTQFSAFGIIRQVLGDGMVHFDPARRFHGEVRRTADIHNGVLSELGETIVEFKSVDG